MPSLKQLQHEYDRTRGLWCIDRNPIAVDYEWIKRNAFQLTDYLTGSDDVDKEQINIGRFTLAQSGTPGKMWMTGPSGEGGEVDEKVLEDLLASVF